MCNANNNNNNDVNDDDADDVYHEDSFNHGKTDDKDEDV
jgi:hypothetical protein